jgi:hypothetical protein
LRGLCVGVVIFTVDVCNNSEDSDPVTITSLIDDIHGDLNGQGTCLIPQTIQPGDCYTCEFTAYVSGNAGYVEVDTVTVSGEDDEGNPVSDYDEATVTVTGALPGDVNGDGNINMSDIMQLWYYVADYPKPGVWEIYNQWSADVNCDGQINMADVMTLWYYLAEYPMPNVWQINCYE